LGQSPCSIIIRSSFLSLRKQGNGKLSALLRFLALHPKERLCLLSDNVLSPKTGTCHAQRQSRLSGLDEPGCAKSSYL
jgi:hypothetical protein